MAGALHDRYVLAPNELDLLRMVRNPPRSPLAPAATLTKDKRIVQADFVVKKSGGGVSFSAISGIRVKWFSSLLLCAFAPLLSFVDFVSFVVNVFWITGKAVIRAGIRRNDKFLYVLRAFVVII